MERDEFLKSFGLGLALVCTGTCFQACKKGGNDPDDDDGGGSNSITADISSLTAVGNQTTVSGVLIFRVAEGSQNSSFVATEAICPHQGGTLSWLQTNNRIQCGLHQAQYSASGSVLSQPVGGGSTRTLKIYTTSLSGSTLTINKV